jgi:hypothetical protein
LEPVLTKLTTAPEGFGWQRVEAFRRVVRE